MKRLSDFSSGAVGGAVSESSQPNTNNVMCAAYGCPLPGGISESTKGGGPWFCRFHFNNDRRQFDNITTDLRRKIKDGEPLTSADDSATVRGMKSRMKAKAVPA